MPPRKKAETATAGVVDTTKYNYPRTSIVGHDGKTRHSASNNDAVAKAMLVFVAGGGDIAKVIKANGLGDRYDPAKWENAGLLRMSVGNSLRGLVRKGTPVVIGDVTVKTLEQRVAVPEAVDKAKKTRAKKAA